MNEEQITRNSISVKLSIIIIIGILALGGIMAFLFKYYEIFYETSKNFNSLFSEVSNNVNKNPMQQQAMADASSAANLAANYKSKSKQIVSSYLDGAQGFISSGKMSEETEKSRDQLLALKVDEENKSKHLGMVLLLEEIDRLAKSGNTEKINFKLEELKELSETGN